MKKVTIHRDTNYIQFIAGIETTGNDAGEKMEAFKNDGRWLISNQAQEKYQCPIATLRVLIETGELITQAHHEYSLSERLAIGF